MNEIGITIIENALSKLSFAKLETLCYGTMNVVDRVIANNISLFHRAEKQQLDSLAFVGDKRKQYGILHSSLNFLLEDFKHIDILKDLHILNACILCCESGQGTPQPFHRDKELGHIIVHLVLQKTSHLNGQTEFVPCSHARKNVIKKKYDEVIAPDQNPNDILIYYRNTIHRGVPNVSSQKRILIALTMGEKGKESRWQGPNIFEAYK